MTSFWRLTFECGHYRFWGVGHASIDEPFIGDIVQCEVCPMWEGTGLGAFRTVVGVEALDPAVYRQPDLELHRWRREYLDQSTGSLQQAEEPETPRLGRVDDDERTAFLVISRGLEVVQVTTSEARAHEVAREGGHYVATAPVIAYYGPARVVPPDLPKRPS